MGAIFGPLTAKLIGAAVIAAAVLGLYLYVAHLRAVIRQDEANLAAQAQQLDQLQQINRDNLAELEQIKAAAARQIAALEADRIATEQRATDANAVKKEIVNAPPSDDGPVAPVLGRALQRMFGGTGAPPSH